MIHRESEPVDERVVRCRENAGAAIEEALKHPKAAADFQAIADHWVRLSLEIQAALRRGETPPEIPDVSDLRSGDGARVLDWSAIQAARK